MQKSGVFVLCCTGLMLSTLPALSQQYRSNDPNYSHFYMARQQVTITDETPMVNDQRTQPGAGTPMGGNGGLPASPLPLPKAGWQPYSSTITGLQTALPKVNNGVPPKMPPAIPSGLGAQAGALRPTSASGDFGSRARALRMKSASAAHSAPTAIKSYSSYKGYGGHPSKSAPAVMGSSGENALNSSTQVQGSVLHWRNKHPSY